MTTSPWLLAPAIVLLALRIVNNGIDLVVRREARGYKAARVAAMTSTLLAIIGLVKAWRILAVVSAVSDLLFYRSPFVGIP